MQKEHVRSASHEKPQNDVRNRCKDCAARDGCNPCQEYFDHLSPFRLLGARAHTQ